MTRRFVRMFKPRFAALVKAGTKKQTIRPTPKRMPKPGDIIDCREWTGKPYRSKQEKIGEFSIRFVEPVTIDQHTLVLNGHERFLRDWFAREDGFRDWQEMLEWFERQHGLPFVGILISW